MKGNGDLYTALITGGDRLVLMKNGVVLGQSHPLFGTQANSTETSGGLKEEWPTAGRNKAPTRCASSLPSSAYPSVASPQVFWIALCGFVSDFFRVAVATSCGMLLFELDDAGPLWSSAHRPGFWLTEKAVSSEVAGAKMRCEKFAPKGPEVAGSRPVNDCGGAAALPALKAYECLRWRHIDLSVVLSAVSYGGSVGGASLQRGGGTTAHSPTTAGYSLFSPSACSTAGGTNPPVGSPYTPPPANTPNGVQTPRVNIAFRNPTVRVVEFVSSDTVCILTDTEAVLLELKSAMLAHSIPGAGTLRKPSPAASSDTVLWRSMGVYRGVAVCQERHHIALTRGPSTIVVFPSLITPPSSSSTSGYSFFDNGSDAFSVLGGGLGRGQWCRTGGSSAPASPVFSPPAHHSTSIPSSVCEGGVSVNPCAPKHHMTLAERGLSASIGSYVIKKVEWHRVSTHTLLCIIGSHRRDGMDYVVLYTVQSISSVRSYTNVMEEHEDGSWGLCEGDQSGGGWQPSTHPACHESVVQLVPSGVIPLTYTSVDSSRAMGSADFSVGASTQDSDTLDSSTLTWQGRPLPSVKDMHTGLVPHFAHGVEVGSQGSRMEFIHVEAEGTVRTSSYAFGRQKHASFAKQRTMGLVCTGLLRPLLDMYGQLNGLTVLPAWFPRAIELGLDATRQPQATEVMLASSRRYRLVLRFVSGIVAVVMVDVSASFFRLECFLSIGSSSVWMLQVLPQLSRGLGRDVVVDNGAVLMAGLLGIPDGMTPRSDFVFSPRENHCPLTVDDTGTFAHGVTSSGNCWGIVILLIEGPELRSKVLTIAPLRDSHVPVGLPTSALTVPPSFGLRLSHHTAASSSGSIAAAGSNNNITSCGMSGLQTTIREGGGMAVVAPSNTVAAAADLEEGSVVTISSVQAYMSVRCPDKLKLLPALLVAVQNDAARLLIQLTAKYGPLEADEPVVMAPHLGGTALEPSESSSFSLPRHHSGPCFLAGCVSDCGSVKLCIDVGTGGTADVTAGCMIVQVCPPPMDCLAPVHEMVAAGTLYIPFASTADVLLSSLSEGRMEAWLTQWDGTCCKDASALNTSAAAEAIPSLAARCALEELAISREAKCRASVIHCKMAFSSAQVARGTFAAAVATSTSFSTANIEVVCPLLPSEFGTSVSQRSKADISVQLERSEAVKDLKAITLVNNDVVVGVLCGHRDCRHGTLHLYSLVAVQSLTEALQATQFEREVSISGVRAFFFSRSGEVVVLRSSHVSNSGSRASVVLPKLPFQFQRWFRCFPGADGKGKGSVANSFSSTVYVATNGYSYVQDTTWCTMGCREEDEITAITDLELPSEQVSATQLGVPLFYCTSAVPYLSVQYVPLRRATSASFPHAGDDVVGTSGVSSSEGAAAFVLPPYHPDAMMQLIGMAHWSVLGRVLSLIATVTKDALLSPVGSSDDSQQRGLLGSLSPKDIVRSLCTSSVARGFQSQPQTVAEDAAAPGATGAEKRIPVIQLSEEDGVLAEERYDSLGSQRLADLAAVCGASVAELMELLPQVTLEGLTRHEQLGLLCIVHALHSAISLSHGVDEAAARYLFFTRLTALRRRLRLPNADLSTAATAASTSDGPINSVLYFEVGRTATRALTTASYLWAAMSDSQTALSTMLFDTISAPATAVVDRLLPPSSMPPMPVTKSSSLVGGSSTVVTWEIVEQSGAPFWLRSPSQLRLLAERIARQQYQSTKSLTDCALMYCVAGKVGTLAALAKAQNNMRLHAFFSRDFKQEQHRAAASANAFAAVSKNMPHYGAAFFLLAGDVRSAAQVLLQRCHDGAQALFILRSFSTTKNMTAGSANSIADETELQWYVRQRDAEVVVCGALDLWERTCLDWLDEDFCDPELAVQCKLRAMRRLADHPTAHPEVLCALRYARQCVPVLAHRVDAVLSRSQEIECLLRLGRYCAAHHLRLNSALHYRDAELLLDVLCKTPAGALHAERGGAAHVQATAGSASASADESARRPVAKMEANYATGTLAFHSFDESSSGDDDVGNEGDAEALTKGELDIHMGQPPPTFVPSKVEAMVRAELRYVRSQLNYFPPRKSEGEKVEYSQVAGIPAVGSTAVRYEFLLFHLLFGVFNRSTRSLNRQQHRTEQLLILLLVKLSREDWSLAASEMEGRDAPVVVGKADMDDGWWSLCTPLLHLVLAAVAAYTRNYPLLLALQRTPMDTATLISDAKCLNLLPFAEPEFMVPCTAMLRWPLLSFFLLLLHHLAATLAEVREAVSPHGSTGTTTIQTSSNNDIHQTHVEGGDRGGHQGIFDILMSTVAAASTSEHAFAENAMYGGVLGGGPLSPQFTEEEQAVLLLSCGQAHQYLQLLGRIRNLALAELEHLTRTPTMQRAYAEGLLYEAPKSATEQAACFSRRLLLCALLLVLGVEVDQLCVECGLHLDAATPHHLADLSGHPNGTLIEVGQITRTMAVVLLRVLSLTVAADCKTEADALRKNGNGQRAAPETSALSDETGDISLLLVELCTTQVGLLNTLPSAALSECRLVRSFTSPLLTTLQATTKAHPSAYQLLSSLLCPETCPEQRWRSSKPSPAMPSSTTTTTTVTVVPEPSILDCPPLSVMWLSWLRRHHTHAVVRNLLLLVSLEGRLTDGPIITDRLILTQNSHSVQSVQFDQSSCDSVVWSTASGTSVSHGFRELLAGDNEAILLSQAPERNIATSSFTLGLATQQHRLMRANASGSERTPDVVEALAAKVALEGRPRCSVAADSLPSSHPHLPFFLTRHHDGHLDLFPFASQECVATFDGTLSPPPPAVSGGTSNSAIWRGDGDAGVRRVAGPLSKSQRPCSARYPTTPVAYSANGYLIAAGMSDGSVACWRFTAAAVECPPIFQVEGLFSPLGIRSCAYCGNRSSLLAVVGVVSEPHRCRRNGPTLSPTTLPTPASPELQQSHGVDQRRRTPSLFQEVGQVLILDTALSPGRVVARCALPFLPAHALYIPSLHVVLVTSAEGHFAAYGTLTGHLSLIGGVPLSVAMSSKAASFEEGDADQQRGHVRPLAGCSTKSVASIRGTGAEGTPMITCVAVSAYDDIVGFGTSHGMALLLHFDTIKQAMRAAYHREVENGENAFLYYPLPSTSGVSVSTKSSVANAATAPLSSIPAFGTEYMRDKNGSVLMEATCVQMAPQVHQRCGVEDLVFTPSMLLAGLRDGKVIAAALIPQSVRHSLTIKGSSYLIGLD